MRLIVGAALLLSMLCSQPQPLMALPLLLKAGKWADEAGEAASAAAKAAKAARAARKIAAVDRLSAIAASGKAATSAYLMFNDQGAVLVNALGKEFSLSGAFDDLGKFRVSDAASDKLRQFDLFFDEDDLPHVDLDSLANGVRSLTLRRGEAFHRIKRFDAGGETVVGFEEAPNLFLDISRDGLGAMRWIVDQPFFRHDIRVISLFDPLDVDMRHALGAALGELHNGFSGPIDGLINMISGQKGKTVVIVGHVEDGAFVMRDPLGRQTGRFAMADIERASLDTDGTILFLGCEAAVLRAVTGFTGCVRGDLVAASLAKAIEQDTLGAFLGVIARESGEMLIRPDFAASKRARFKALHVRRGGSPVNPPLFSSVSGGTLSSSRAGDLSWRLIPALPWYWPIAYIGGAVLLLLTPKESWSRWKDVWWDAPDRQIAPVGHLLGVFGRLLSFLVLGPALIAYRAFLQIAPWCLLIWMLLTTPSLIFSVTFAWIAMVAKEDRDTNGTGLVTLTVGGGFLYLWALLFGSPEPWHFFTDRDATSFTVASLVIGGCITFAIARIVRISAIDPAEVKRVILNLPILALRWGIAGIRKSGGYLWGRHSQAT